MHRPWQNNGAGRGVLNSMSRKHQVDGEQAAPNLMPQWPLQRYRDRAPRFVHVGWSQFPPGRIAAPVAKQGGEARLPDALQPAFNPLRGGLRGGGGALDGLAGQERADGDKALANAPARLARQGGVNLVQSDAK